MRGDKVAAEDLPGLSDLGIEPRSLAGALRARFGES